MEGGLVWDEINASGGGLFSVYSVVFTGVAERSICARGVYGFDVFFFCLYNYI